MKSIFISILIITVFLCSCKTENKKQTITASQEIMIDTATGSCPYLTADNKNNIVLSWIKQVDKATSIVCYAVSKDEGKSFGKSIEIPGSKNVLPHGENMPKIVFKPSGEIIAVWGSSNPNPANQYAGLVYYSQSFDAGKTWRNPTTITNDTASFDERYFDIALLPNGEAAVVWLDNRKQWNTEGSGLYYAVTTGNKGFQNERLISGPCCQCCRTDLFIDKQKNIHVVYRAIINNTVRDMVHIVSTDEGKSFSSPQRISADNWVINGCPHTGPAITENKEGLQFAWFTGGKDAGIYYNNSKDNGKTFTARDSVSGAGARHCQISTLQNNNTVIVWNESFSNGNKFCNCIGMEERNANGNRLTKQYLTGKNSDASFPVIYPLDANKAVIAYTDNINKRDHVLFKQINF